MLTFYIDGQSVGNEKIGSPRKAKLVIAFRPEIRAAETTPRILSEDIGDRTNNEAEYDALLRLLSILSAGTGADRRTEGGVRIYSDSEVLVKQLNGEYKVREDRLRELRDSARKLMKELGSIHVEKVPREENLAGLWLEGKIAGRKVKPDEFLLGLQ